MNEYILYGLYGAGIMCLITLIKSLITKKPDITLIPNSIFGFVSGAIGVWVVNQTLEKIYPLSHVLGILVIGFWCLSILLTAIAITIRGVE